MIYVLDCGHSMRTAGKRSPDGMFKEYEYNRIIGKRVSQELKKLGIEHYFTYPLEAREDLALTKRAEVANDIARKRGAKNVLLISIHSNAAGNGTDWMTAKGWSIWTTRGKTNSDKYAEIFYQKALEIARKYGRNVRADKTDGDGDWESNFTVIFKTICPSVLIEEFFYDCKEEKEWLLSEEGMECCTRIIVEGILEIEKNGIGK